MVQVRELALGQKKRRKAQGGSGGVAVEREGVSNVTGTSLRGEGGGLVSG